MSKILVLGDNILDKYVQMQAIKISEEAPVIVGKVIDKSYYLGGAANAAINIKNMGIDVDIVRINNCDTNGKILDELLESSGINVIRVEGGSPPTTVKTRYMVGSHQIVRVDEERIEDLKYDLSKINVGDYNVIVISDYAKGVINESLVFNSAFSTTDIVVNGKPKNIHLYTGATYLVMNEKEVNEVIANHPDILQPEDICHRFNILRLVMTKGDRGISIYDNVGEITSVDAEKVNVKSTVGCGDSVTAAIVYGLIRGFDTDLELITFANKVAAIKCTKAGTAPIQFGDIPNLGE
jgi:rfaE bifunctional protein kinase chain/domain